MTEEKNTDSKALLEWEGDALGRKKEGDYLTTLLTNRFERYKNGDEPNTFVLNLHSEWGFGKTFFLKKWAEDLEKAGYPVIYFDAWQNDFCEHPLLAFLSEIKEGLKISEKDQNWKKIGNLLETGFIGIASKFTGIDLDKVDTKNKGAFAKLKDFKDTQIAIEAFKKGMSSLVKNLNKEDSQKLPLIIIVNELDRCRPNFSIELLENIKHLFEVDGVYFVVATDTNQLAHSVQALYGQNFDGRRYLQRFFDQEFSLPKPDNKSFANFLFETHKLREEFRLFSPISGSEKTKNDPNVELFALCSKFFGIGLREQIQCCQMLENLTLTWELSSSIHLGFLLPLIILFKKDQEAFAGLIQTDQLFVRSYPKNILDEVDDSVLFVTEEYVISQGSKSGGHPNISFPLRNIFSYYYHFKGLNLTKLKKYTAKNLVETKIQERLVEEQHGANNSFLSKYPELVRQAGYLKNGSDYA